MDPFSPANFHCILELQRYSGIPELHQYSAGIPPECFLLGTKESKSCELSGQGIMIYLNGWDFF